MRETKPLQVGALDQKEKPSGKRLKFRGEDDKRKERYLEMKTAVI